MTPETKPETSATTPPTRTRALKRLAVVLVIFALYHAAVLFVSALNLPRAKLTGFDALALPGEVVKLRARIETDGPTFLNPDLVGIELEFRLAGKHETLPVRPGARSPDEGTKLGATTSKAGGHASLDFQAPEEPGNYLVHVSPGDRTAIELESSDPYLIVAVTPPEHPIVVTDIDNTICQSESGATRSDQPNRVPPFADAASVLSSASRQSRIVYLTSRPTHMAMRTRHWLGHHRFPPGPVFFRDLRGDRSQGSFSEPHYKAIILSRELRQKWNNVPWGIGNVRGDAEAYVANGIQPILIKREGLLIDEVGGRRVQSWQEIGNIFTTEGFARREHSAEESDLVPEDRRD